VAAGDGGPKSSEAFFVADWLPILALVLVLAFAVWSFGRGGGT
jgi:hypothetical protein